MPVAITTSYYEISFNNLYFFVSLKIILIYIEHAMSSCNFADHKIKLIFLPSWTGEFLFEHAFRVLMYPLRCLKLFDGLIWYWCNCCMLISLFWNMKYWSVLVNNFSSFFFFVWNETYNLMHAHSPKLILDKHRYEILTSLDLFHVHVIQSVGISQLTSSIIEFNF